MTGAAIKRRDRCNRRTAFFASGITILALLIFHTTDSIADEWPKSVVPVGIDIGYGWNGYVIGAEASYVRLIHSFGVGAYLDGLKSRDDLRSNIGVEFFTILSGSPILGGVCFGPAVRRHAGKLQKGFSVELFTFAYALPYCRYSVFRHERIFEGGVLIKIPILVE